MIFIKFTGSKPTSTSNNLQVKSTKRQHGIFECPICGAQKELSLTAGKRNKSCGSKECRKVAGSFKGSKKVLEQPLQAHPYYSNIATFHSNIIKNNEVTLDNTIKRLRDFFNATITKYEEAKRQHPYNKITVNYPLKKNLIATDISFGPYIRKYTKVKKYKPTGNSRGYIYIVKCCDAYKIGIATNVDDRIKSLQTGNPNIIEKVYSKYTTSTRSLEAYLHMLYKDKKLIGEWFKLDVIDIEDILEICETTISPSGDWEGATITLHETMSTANFKEKVNKDERASQLLDKYHNKLKGEATPKEQTPCVIPPVPEKFKKESKTKHPMYIAHRTLINNKQKGYKVSDRLDDFDVFKGAYEAIYNTLNKPTLVTKDKHYSLQNTTFKEACDVSNNTRIIAIIKGNDTVGIYNSIKEAADAIGGTPAHISACCSGKRKSHKGFTFKYIDSK